MYVINVVLINHVLNLGAHVLFGGEKKSSAKPCFVRSQLDSDRCLFIHICTLHVQEMNTSCAGAPAGNTDKRRTYELHRERPMQVFLNVKQQCY